MSASFSLAGRTVALTGAARGLGAAFATGLADAGADLVLVDRTEPIDTAAAVTSLGRRCRSYVIDLADTSALAPLVDTIRSEAGPIHVLVNNAGVARLEQFNEITPAGWHEIMAVNAEAPFFLAQRVAEHMIADGIEGRIVNISSKNGLVAEAGLAHYNASKAALELITKSLAAELGPHGITCNAVAPGMIATPIADDFDADLAGLFDSWQARIPLGRFGTPDDCVGAVIYLASDASRYVTGTTLVVDGGALADQLPRLRFLPPYRSSL
ncbi:NAD(P)-dependent dehydrogenase (short-subunit alcohol dehydrogenase family) [Kribbella aluminosa]|uniref:NAD(P)-dependent dehydrogenase (Short-subunit alcohol dehydrogenase family) n=1 Tax=Kribbella aluminosa TaxID=416017 RepID=A0ABS4UFU5_9ACTN|nr:SDR family oxidoreductase [Kribbella aluminosa]MBP2350517.1 NAD(P)-dependent dehydrogenase (short-subunit alcohol dehydrogenase family) [Kribbella aluminosa]